MFRVANPLVFGARGYPAEFVFRFPAHLFPQYISALGDLVLRE